MPSNLQNLQNLVHCRLPESSGTILGTSGIEKLRAHPNRDAEPPKRIPRQTRMQQSVTTQKTARRIPSLCSTTGVCWRKPISVTGAGAAIRRLLPTGAVLCRPPAKMPCSAAICRLLPTFADLKFLVQNSRCRSLSVWRRMVEALNDRRTPWVGREAAHVLSPALSGERGGFAQR